MSPTALEHLVASTVADDLALLIALAARHPDLPVDAAIGLSAAVDELTDPLAPPDLVVLDDDATRDPATVLTAVAGRLHAAATSAPDVRTALACARAARELRAALQALTAARSGHP